MKAKVIRLYPLTTQEQKWKVHEINRKQRGPTILKKILREARERETHRDKERWHKENW